MSAVEAPAGQDIGRGMVKRLTREDAERLGTRIQAHAAHVAEAMCAFLLLIAEFDARDGVGWFVGLKSTAHWLAWSCSMSPGTAREHVRVARALPRMPATTREFAAGRLSYSKVREMTRLVGRIDEDRLLELARAMTASQLSRSLAAFRAADNTRMPQEAARAASWRVREDGMIEIHAVLPAETGAEVVTALDLAVRQDGTVPSGDAGAPPAQGEDPDGVPEIQQRKADALLELARTYLDAEPADRSGEDRHLVIVHVTPDALVEPPAALAEPTMVQSGDLHGADAPVGTLPEADAPAGTLTEADAPAGTPTAGTRTLDPSGRRHRCGVEGLGPLEPATARRLACTGALALLVASTDGEVLHLGRTRRLASAAQRRALRATQHTCQFPGCHQSRHLDVHHVVPWNEGGSTDVDDLALLCRRHHMLVHEGGLTVHRVRDRAPGAARFEVRDSSGRAVEARWPHAMEEARIRPLKDHPLRWEEPGRRLAVWGEGNARIAPTTAGYDFHLDDAVTRLLQIRSEDGADGMSRTGTQPDAAGTAPDAA